MGKKEKKKGRKKTKKRRIARTEGAWRMMHLIRGERNIAHFRAGRVIPHVKIPARKVAL